ncbi:MAG: hypothetical protein A2096_01245 [Spirochaetes bacterium GWF1_41_5]|nr:MAG: hypothetical protein A2096_01245 [Spirochaetes bacterium GWF1_41_5]HBE00879.1 hypothetical protein [Spirochaetia bacterium]
MLTRTYRLLLLNPKVRYPHYVNQTELANLLGKKSISYPLSLPLIAALTPAHYLITIKNEEIEQVPFKQQFDLVGITTTATSMKRACEIADYFHSRGSIIIMGGTGASYMQEQALAHADSIITGEAEGAWKDFITDFERGKPKKIYRSSQVEYRTSPLPRWDLVSTDLINSLPVQISRGCPFRCEFCVVSELFGNKMRMRDIDDVISEIKSLPVDRIFFVDDNLTVNRAYAGRLMAELKKLSINWTCQCDVRVASDKELLAAMADAGCFSILVGMESLNPQSLKDAGKYHNTVERYRNAVENIHNHGMHLFASFIVGFDSDTESEFERIRLFALDAGIAYLSLNILTVVPGTILYERMKKHDRLQNNIPDFINGIFPSMRYKLVSQTGMLDAFFSALRRMYHIDSFAQIAEKLFSCGSFTRIRSGRVGFFIKLKISLLLVYRYIFKSAKHRMLMIRLFSMAGRGILSYDEAVIFLLSMAGFEDYLQKAGKFIPEARKVIAAADPGPLDLRKNPY